MSSFKLHTRQRCQMLDITAQVNEAIHKAGLRNGLAIVHVPHTTAAVTINENADPNVVHDMLLTLEELAPEHRRGYRHAEGNSDAHVKSSLLGCTQVIVVEDGRACLGTWQGVYFCEFDGPRHRHFLVHLQPA